MKNKAVIEKRSLLSRRISLVVSFLITVFALAVYALIHFDSLAWFAHNERVNTEGLQISCKNEDIRFTDTITVSRTFDDRVINIIYHRDSDYLYYRWDETTQDWYLRSVVNDAGEIIHNVREDFNFAGLLPNETLAVTVSFTNIGRESQRYTLDMENITGEVFTTGGNTYTILGVYMVGETFIQPIDGSGTVARLHLGTGDIESGATGSATFTIKLNLDQYAGLGPNSMLSEKSMEVGSITIDLID